MLSAARGVNFHFTGQMCISSPQKYDESQ